MSASRFPEKHFFYADNGVEVSEAVMAKDEEEILDEDQQKAFDSIMAQIQGGDGVADAVEKPAPEGSTAVDDEVAFAAELENAAQEASAGKAASSSSDGATKDDEDGLDDEQQKALDSIMAQIGGGDGSAKEVEEKAREEGAAVDDEVDFAAELEKVVQEASAGEIVSSSSNEVSIDEEDLDEDQQKAFDSIMAQIGGGDGDAEKVENPAREESEAVDDDIDFAAELEKVVQEASAGKAGPSSSEESSDDGEVTLDDEQQKALDSIMAQIEGGDGDAETLEDSAREEGAAVDDEVDFAAALEKVAQEASAETNASSTAEEDSDDDEVGLDDEQQKAFESIMAQINEGNNDTDDNVDEPDADAEDSQRSVEIADESNDSEPPSAVESEQETPAEEEVPIEDISDEIDDILAEVRDEEDEPEEADDTGEKEDIVVAALNGGTLPPEAGKDQKDESGKGKKRTTTNQEKSSGEKKQSKSKKKDDTPSPVASKGTKRVEPLREAAPTKAKRKNKKRVVLLSTGFVILLSFAGYFFWTQKIQRGSENTTVPIAEAVVHKVPEEVHPASSDPVEQAFVEDSSDVSRLKMTAEALMRLRERVMEKQTEIDELQGYYQTGIEAEVNAIMKIVQDAKMEERSHEAAMKDPRIRLGLTAIQRRDSYIQKLKEPAKQLLDNGEELLFLSRKAELLALMAEKTSDLEIDGFIRTAEEIAASHGAHLENLNIDADSATSASTQSIWRDIIGRLPKKQAIASVGNVEAAKTDNSQIWKQICDGDLSQRHRLTQLNPSAAKCLAAWDGKDLYLNNLTELSPEVAAQLAQWDGDWLGLNGLTELSPEAASHLARWKGKKLSLNGLTRLSPRVVAILSEWRGEQIELINVKHMAHWENQNTRLFLSEDLQRKRLVKGD